MGFDSVLFADTAATAALSCFSRLATGRDSGQRALIVALCDAHGADAIRACGLAEVRLFDEVERENGLGSAEPWRERLSVLVRKLGATHVLAPLGLLGASQSIDYFPLLRAALRVDKARDLLFFEERPQCLVPELLMIRLAALGARLPPATVLRSGRRYLPFALRLVTGLGIPPIFGGAKERFRLGRSVRPAFKDAQEWDAQRALGPKVQPVSEGWREQDAAEFFALSAELGESARMGSSKVFKRRLARHAATAGKRMPIERCWLSLPSAEPVDSASES